MRIDLKTGQAAARQVVVIAADGKSRLYGEILDVSVFIVAPGEAEVRGLTVHGINSRWGPAKRSTQDAACWMGADFRICAR